MLPQDRDEVALVAPAPPGSSCARATAGSSPCRRRRPRRLVLEEVAARRAGSDSSLAARRASGSCLAPSGSRLKRSRRSRARRQQAPRSRLLPWRAADAARAGSPLHLEKRRHVTRRRSPRSDGQNAQVEMSSGSPDPTATFAMRSSRSEGDTNTPVRLRAIAAARRGGSPARTTLPSAHTRATRGRADHVSRAGRTRTG